MRIKLDKKWTKFLLSIPESGMGYQIVDITFNNGNVIKGVNVFNAEELELPDGYKIDKIDKIDSIVLHEKEEK